MRPFIDGSNINMLLAHVTAFPMSQVESIPEGFFCPISGEVFVDPVQAPDGYM